jgi:hemerythrin-like domain-containing protein
VSPGGEAPRSSLLPEEERPHAPEGPDEPMTPAGRVSRQTLVQVHDHLRAELAQIQEVVSAVAQGRLDPESARSVINRMTIRQNLWTVGSFCAHYCRIVTVHHTIEDRHMFPALRREDGALAGVLRQLGQEHEIIAAVLERFDRTLVAMVTDPAGIEEVRRLAGELGDALLSHFAYEERELLGPLGRSDIVV